MWLCLLLFFSPVFFKLEYNCFQYCLIFCYTMKWISHMYMYIYMYMYILCLLDLPLIQHPSHLSRWSQLSSLCSIAVFYQLHMVVHIYVSPNLPVCKWSNWHKINLQNTQAAHTAQYQHNKRPNQKMGRRPK